MFLTFFSIIQFFNRLIREVMVIYHGYQLRRTWIIKPECICRLSFRNKCEYILKISWTLSYNSRVILIDIQFQWFILINVTNWGVDVVFFNEYSQRYKHSLIFFWVEWKFFDISMHFKTDHSMINFIFHGLKNRGLGNLSGFISFLLLYSLSRSFKRRIVFIFRFFILLHCSLSSLGSLFLFLPHLSQSCLFCFVFCASLCPLPLLSFDFSLHCWIFFQFL